MCILPKSAIIKLDYPKEGAHFYVKQSEILKKLIQEYDVKTTRDVQEMLKDLFAENNSRNVRAELDEHLGYDRYDIQNKNTTNSRMDIGVRKFDLILEKLV